jgi:hypothetical protein
MNRLATQATIHCLTGCSIGEVLGMVIATALAWHDLPSILLSIVLAFFFGYALTVRPLSNGGLPLGRAARLALASDTVSIATMEIVNTRSSWRSPARWRLAWSIRCSGAASPCHSRSRGASPGRSTAG